MEIALLLEDVTEYCGKELGKYNLNWGSAGNGIKAAATFLAEFDKVSIEYIYFGNEFCEYRIPTIVQFKRMFELCEKEKIKLVLVTPVVTDYGIERISQLLDFIAEQDYLLDIVVNDVGVLQLINQKKIKCAIIAGRILDKTSHDSRASVKELDLYYGKNGKKFAMTPGVISGQALQVYQKYGIDRFEFDLPKIGLDIPKNIKSSVYWPYSYLTTGRVCMLRATELNGNRKFLVGNRGCGQLCRKYQVEKRKPINGFGFENKDRITDLFLFQRGNTVFFINRYDDFKPFIKKFNRLIVQI